MATWLVHVFALVAATWLRVNSQQVYEEAPTVQIELGAVRGTYNYTADGTKYYQFLGIPYAKPPVGNLRFAAPEHHESWSGVRDATEFGSKCCQAGIESDCEDCLFMNVFTPQLPTNGKNAYLLPVMVYIHGGAFKRGSGNLAPGQLLDHGVVVASLNYRLSIFGFLSINGTDASGNAGLKDQSAALRWVQKNIAKFGGDPGNVTIFGESAGGASVQYQVLSPMSKGLFIRAITESGSSLDRFAFKKNSEAQAYLLGTILEKNVNNAEQLLRILRATLAAKLVSSMDLLLTAEDKMRLTENPFVPSLEFPRNGEKVFLPHEPAYIERNGLFNKVPYIIGVTKMEASIFVNRSLSSEGFSWQAINDNLEVVVPENLDLAKGSDKSLEVAQKVKNFYFGNKNISNETLNQWTDLQTDLLIVNGVVQTLHSHAIHSTSATYSYQFVYGDAHHAAELSYVTYGGKVQGQSSDNARVARLLGGLWTSFAKTGVPSVEGAVTWEPVGNGSFPYLEIDVNPSLKHDVEKDRMDFWFDIYNKYSNYTPTLLKE